jgi:hypothetical protein
MTEGINPLDTFVTGITIITTLTVLMKLISKIKRPIVWVIEDSATEQALMKTRLKTDHCDIRYFSNSRGIVMEYLKAKLLLSGPSAVAVDYFLNDGIDGDKTLNFFRDNGVETILLTGYLGDISGIPKSSVIRKEMDNSHIAVLQTWINKVIGLEHS